MKKVPENELFSAYLDGELTAAEQAEVEQLLATSPAARQLMDELRALSVTLQSLPVQRLGEDLSERVLHAAERRMLADPGCSDGRQPPANNNGSLWRAILRRVARPRNLLWPAAAIAAAWLLTTNPELGQRAPPRRGAKQVAVAPREERSTPARSPTIGPARDPDHQPAAVAIPPREGPPAFSKPYTAKGASAEAAAGRPPTAAQSAPPTIPSGPLAPKPSALAAGPAPAAKSVTAEKAAASPEPKGRALDKGTGEVLIVRCDVTEEAIAKGLLEKTLGKHGLATHRKVSPPQGEALGGKAARCVEVEATTAELLAAVGELKAQPDMFRAVSLPAGLLPEGPGERTPKTEGLAKQGVIKMQVRIGPQPMVAKDSGASFGTATQGVQVGPSTARSIEIRPPAPPQSPDTAKRRVQFMLRIVSATGP